MINTSISFRQLSNLLDIHFKIRSKDAVWLHGRIGIGKTQFAEQWAKKHNLFFIPLIGPQKGVEDISGLPWPKEGDKKVSMLSPEFFIYEDEELPEGYDGVLLFFDELDKTATPVQNAFLNIIQDKANNGRKLHPNTFILAAGNKTSDKSFSSRVSMALRNRFCHYDLEPVLEDWINDYALPANVPSQLTAYLLFQEKWFNSVNFARVEQGTDHNFPTPRSIASLGEFIKTGGGVNKAHLASYRGYVGTAFASEFLDFCEYHDKMPDIEMIFTSPEKVDIPPQKEVLYSLSTALFMKATDKNVDAIFTYMQRMPHEFVMMLGRLLKDKSMDWLMKPSATPILKIMSEYNGRRF